MKRNDTKVVIQFAVIVAACVLAYGIYFSLMRTVSDTRSSLNPTSMIGRIQDAVYKVRTDAQYNMGDTTRKAGTYVVSTANNAYRSMQNYSSYLKSKPSGLLGKFTDWLYGDALKQMRCYQSQRLNRATRVYDYISSKDSLLQSSKNSRDASMWSKVGILLAAILVFILLIRRNVRNPEPEETYNEEQISEPALVPEEMQAADTVEVPGEGKKESKVKFFEEKESGEKLTKLCEKYDLNRDEMLELYGDEKKAAATLTLYDFKCLNDLTKMDTFVNEDKSKKIVDDITDRYDLSINAKNVYGAYKEAAENLQQYEQECGDDKQKMFEIMRVDMSYQRAVRNLCEKYNLEVSYALSVYGDIEDTYGHLQSYAKLYGRDKTSFVARVHDDANKGSDTNMEEVAESVPIVEEEN